VKIAIRAEGSTDIGVLAFDGSLTKGPMLILIEKLDCYQNLYSELGCTEEYNSIEWVYIHKKEIEDSSEKRRQVILRGKKSKRKEFVNKKDEALLKGFYKNSESFAFLAKEQDSDIAIFFVDTDNDVFEDRYKETKLGLAKHNFNDTGVPMIPTKISESWLMCCLGKYKNCIEHENVSTDKTNPNRPKKVCERSGFTRHEIAQNCDPNKIDMPSFNRFREDFKKAVNFYINGVCE